MSNEVVEKITELDYTLGNIILSNHVQLEARIKMIKEVMKGHGYCLLPELKRLSDTEIKQAIEFAPVCYIGETRISSAVREWSYNHHEVTDKDRIITQATKDKINKDIEEAN